MHKVQQKLPTCINGRNVVIKKFLHLGLSSLLLTACFAQDPARVVDKKDNFYGSEIASKKQKLVLSTPIDSTYKFDDTVEVSSMPKLENKRKIVSEKSSKNLAEAKTNYAKKETKSQKFEDGFSNANLTEERGVEKAKSISQNNSDSFSLATPLGRKSFTWPVKGKITSHFGKKGNKFNEGINIAAPAGTIVNSAAKGKVIYIGKDIEGYGNLVIVKHKEGGIMTAYAHLQDILVSKGSEVSKGEGLGTIGETGSVKNPQLHFSVRKGKKTIDPEKRA